jgi:hypothetical protein
LIFPLLLSQSGCGTLKPIEKAPIVLYETVTMGSHPLFSDVVRDAADRAPVNVSFDPDTARSSDYRLDLEFTIRDKGLHDTEAIWTMTTILLLTMYPATCGHFELALSGDLYDPDGNRLRTWEIVEQDTAFLWLFQGDDCGTEPATDSIQEAASKMLSKLYARMSQDGAFSGKWQISANNEPPVYVNAVNAEELVNKLLKTDAPFPNYTTDKAFADMAERVLKVEYESNTPETGLGGMMGRTMMSIMTIGVASQCPKNSMILNAEVLAADGSVLRRYRFMEKTRASLFNDCAAPTDATHPELARKLLRQLFRQMRKDNRNVAAMAPHSYEIAVKSI